MISIIPTTNSGNVMDFSVFLMKCIVGTPTWVWVLFVYLLSIGIKAIKTQIASIPRLFLMPVVFIVVNSNRFLFSSGVFEKTREGISAVSIFNDETALLFILFTILGILIGYYVMSRVGFEVYKPTQESKIKSTIELVTKSTVKIPGSYYILVFIIFVFSIRYVFGFLHAVNPTLDDQLKLLECSISSILIGFALGRAVCVLKSFITFR